MHQSKLKKKYKKLKNDLFNIIIIFLILHKKIIYIYLLWLKKENKNNLIKLINIYKV